MSKRLRHIKIKNTGVLFEVLTRQVTADIMENVESKAVALIKKHFQLNKYSILLDALFNQLNDKALMN